MARFFLYILVAALTGWVTQHQQAALAYLVEENRVLRALSRRFCCLNAFHRLAWSRRTPPYSFRQR